MTRVLQLIDSLEAGGAERLSVSFANILVSNIDKSFLCSTRAEGVLKSTLREEVGYLFLKKKSRVDLKAVLKLKNFIKANRIDVIHAHSTSFFLATQVKMIYPKIKIVWHDHYGQSEFLEDRPLKALKFCSRFFNHIFCVNKILLNWAEDKLKCNSVSYLQNMVLVNDTIKKTKLKGKQGKRILCLANLREQKDHLTLFKAFKKTIEIYPDWTLHCVGKDFDDSYSKEIKEFVNENNLRDHLYFYGSCPDVNHLLSQSEIGILSSKSEGLPIALLEYGYGNLVVIATDVGDCKLVIDSKEVGILTEPENPNALNKALIYYIENKIERKIHSENFHRKVVENFSKESVLQELLKVYRS